MEIIIKTVYGTTIRTETEVDQTPIAILKKLAAHEPETAELIVTDTTALAGLQNAEFDTSRSVFELETADGGSICCDWSTPLCNQPDVKNALAELESNGITPVFDISITSIVG